MSRGFFEESTSTRAAVFAATAPNTRLTKAACSRTSAVYDGSSAGSRELKDPSMSKDPLADLRDLGNTLHCICTECLRQNLVTEGATVEGGRAPTC
jgi:hypothetical protein